jgi:hypothetical protein
MTREEIYTKSFEELLEEREKRVRPMNDDEPETRINYNVGSYYIKSRGSVKAWHKERNLDY